MDDGVFVSSKILFGSEYPYCLLSVATMGCLTMGKVRVQCCIQRDTCSVREERRGQADSTSDKLYTKHARTNG